MSAVSGAEVFAFEGFTLDARRRRLFGPAGAPLPLSGRAFDTLLYLVEHPNQLIDKHALMKAVWPNAIVEENNLNQNILIVRRTLGETPGEHRFIVTVPGRGLRFVPVVRRLAGTGENTSDTNVHAGTAAMRAAAVGSPGAAPPAPPRPAKWVQLGWIGGTLTIVTLLAAFWTLIHHRESSKPAERTSSAAAVAIHSLAVLPLVNLSGGQEQEYFADGMTDALTTDLARIGSLRVISRTSATQFKGSRETLPQIGRDLKVDAVVEGAVTRGGDRVRVTAQLVEASTDQHLWAKTYEGDLKDVLALQDAIAQDVAEQVRVTLTPKERSLLIQLHAVDPEAYDDYLRGAYWMNQLSLEGYNKACGYFQKAITKDPSYALAYVGVARCQDTPNKYRGFVLKALALDPSLADAHTRLGITKLINDWDWAGAEAEDKQAIALNPNYAAAHLWYSFYLVAMGRPDEAVREIERARDLDPYDAGTTVRLGEVLYHARRYDDALRVDQRGLEMHPNTEAFYWDIADIYEQKKMFAEAFAARQQSLTIRKDPRVTAYGEAYKRAGYKGYLLAQAEFEQTQNTPYAAHCYALADDEPRAIAALEAAYNTREAGILFIRTAPELDSIRSSPGFRDLVRRIGFPPSPSDKTESKH